MCSKMLLQINRPQPTLKNEKRETQCLISLNCLANLGLEGQLLCPTPKFLKVNMQHIEFNKSAESNKIFNMEQSL